MTQWVFCLVIQKDLFAFFIYVYFISIIYYHSCQDFVHHKTYGYCNGGVTMLWIYETNKAKEIIEQKQQMKNKERF